MCPACGASAVANGVCERCGYAEGASNTCPHCNAVARAEPRGEGETRTWVCAVCGGPRVTGNLGGERGKRALREAKARSSRDAVERARAFGWSFLAFATLVPSLLLASLVPSAALAIFAAVSAVLALRASARSRRARRERDDALERAWLSAAEEVASRSKTGITAEELGERLRIGPHLADRLLTKLTVHERTRIDVSDDAEIRYSVAVTDEGESDREREARALAEENADELARGESRR
jgi:type II secretory pathway pseudopilin PulG